MLALRRESQGASEGRDMADNVVCVVAEKATTQER